MVQHLSIGYCDNSYHAGTLVIYANAMNANDMNANVSKVSLMTPAKESLKDVLLSIFLSYDHQFVLLEFQQSQNADWGR